MEILEQIAKLEAPAKAVLADIQTFEAPVPDYALMGGFVILLFALHRSGRAGVKKVQANLEDAYGKELLTANRRMHQARSDLRHAHLELERERQRKRRAVREQGRFGTAKRRNVDAVDRVPPRSVPFKATVQNRNQTRPVDPIPAAASSHDNLFLNGVEK